MGHLVFENLVFFFKLIAHLSHKTKTNLLTNIQRTKNILHKQSANSKFTFHISIFILTVVLVIHLQFRVIKPSLK